MARGQYELPPGRPKPTFGPSRPPIYPPRSPSNSSSASLTPSPTSSAPLMSQGRRANVIILSMTKSEQYQRTIKDLKAKLESEANVEEIGKVDDALNMFARKPTAVIMSEDVLQEASIQAEADRYVQSGGILITDTSRALLALEDALNAGNPPNGGRYAGANLQDPIGSPKAYDRFEQALLERTRTEPDHR